MKSQWIHIITRDFFISLILFSFFVIRQTEPILIQFGFVCVVVATIVNESHRSKWNLSMNINNQFSRYYSIVIVWFMSFVWLFLVHALLHPQCSLNTWCVSCLCRQKFVKIVKVSIWSWRQTFNKMSFDCCNVRFGTWNEWNYLLVQLLNSWIVGWFLSNTWSLHQSRFLFRFSMIFTKS